MTHLTMKSLFGVLTPLVLLALVSFCLVEPREEEIGKLSTQFQKLEEKLDQIQAKNKIPNEFEWHGDQAQFWSFRRKSAEAKAKLKSFHLENTAEMDVARLLEELRPCTNLESLKLDQVELLGTFPNTTEQKLLLPNLNEFSLNLSNYPNIVEPRLVDAIFFKKSDSSGPLSTANMVEAGTNIDIWFAGYRKLYVNHDFHELILDTREANQEIIVGALATPSFKLRRLTVSVSSLNASQLPSDLTYLNLKYVNLEGKVTPTTEFMDLLKERTQLKELHIDTLFDLDYGGVINLDQLAYRLKAVSFRGLRLNTTEPYRSYLSYVETLLFDNCIFDNNVIRRMYQSIHSVKKLAFIFNFKGSPQCHNLLSDLTFQGLFSGDNTPRLESIFVSECQRSFRPEATPRFYNQTESFLEGLGLGGGIRTFELQRSGVFPDYSWSGRRANVVDVRRVKYEFSDWYKLQTRERYT